MRSTKVMAFIAWVSQTRMPWWMDHRGKRTARAKEEFMQACIAQSVLTAPFGGGSRQCANHGQHRQGPVDATLSPKIGS